MSQVDAPPADWYDDPSQRFQYRYWDGEAWTGHVSTDGKTDWDPPGDAAPEESGSTAVDQAASGSEGGSAAADLGVAAAGPTSSEPAQGDGAATDDPWAPDGQAAAAAQPAADPGSGAQAQDAPAAQAAQAVQPSEPQAAAGGTIEGDEPADSNLVANRRAGLEADVEAWLDEVAGQVEPRLSRIDEGWTAQPQAEAARACAYGLLLGHLAHRHPHMRPDLSQVAEAHPSFTTIEEGTRLDTLERIAQDPQRTAAWLGPLVGNEDVDRVRQLFD